MPNALHVSTNSPHRIPTTTPLPASDSVTPQVVSNQSIRTKAAGLDYHWQATPDIVSNTLARLALENTAQDGSPALLGTLNQLQPVLANAASLATHNPSAGDAAVRTAICAPQPGETVGEALCRIGTGKFRRAVERSEQRGEQRRSRTACDWQGAPRSLAPTPASPFSTLRLDSKSGALGGALLLAGLGNVPAANAGVDYQQLMPAGTATATQARTFSATALAASGISLFATGAVVGYSVHQLWDECGAPSAATSQGVDRDTVIQRNVQLLQRHADANDLTALETLDWAIASEGGDAHLLGELLAVLDPRMAAALAEDPIALDAWARAATHLPSGSAPAAETPSPGHLDRLRRAAGVSLLQHCQAIDIGQALPSLEADIRTLCRAASIAAAPQADLAALGSCMATIRTALQATISTLRTRRTTLAAQVTGPGAEFMQIAAATRLIARSEAMESRLSTAITSVNARIIKATG